MGVSMSTLGGWAVVLSCFGFFAFREWNKRHRAQLSKAAAAKSKQDRQHLAPKKEVKEPKPRRQRIEDAGSKATSQPTPPAFAGSYSTDDDADTDNREFARQLLNAKQGTKFAGKAKEETRQKSVKQSRAQEMPTHADGAKVSAPSSTAGIDGDDDQSPAASPVVTAAMASGDVSDMLEQAAPGPSIMRLTNTEEKKPKEKKAKAPEQVETKKQRQNKKKAEAAKAAREEDEKDRKVKMEAQRRLAREAEGRAAKDGSAFMAAQAGKNAWNGNGNGASGKTNGGSGTNGFLPVQPLDTADSKTARAANTAEGDEWMKTLPSEEEQMELVKKEQEEEAWSTVKTKARKPKKVEAAANDHEDAPAVAPPTAAPVAAQPPPPKKQEHQRPVKPFTQKSSFAALSTDSPEQEEEEEEWDV